MRTILTLGITCLLLAITPPASPIERELQWEQVRHMKCEDVCFIVDREY